MPPSRAGAFVRLSRPHFLLGGAVMFALGAFSGGTIDVATYLAGQAMISFAQVTAHFVNEYADVGPDRLVTSRTWFSGGSGVLPAGDLSPAVARRAAVATTMLTLLASLPVASISPPAAVVGLGSLAVSWAYSMPPIRLLGTGWGEAATSLVVTVAVPTVGILSQRGSPGAGLAWAMAALFLLHMAMMLAFELPDLDTDAAAGKRVLAVRIGRRRTIVLMRALVGGAVAAVAVGGIVGALDVRSVAGASLGLVPVAVMLRAASAPDHGVLTAASVVALVVTATALAFGLAT